MKTFIIKVENCYSWLLTEDEQIKKILWDNLRFRQRGYFHNPRFKSKMWDGYVNFFQQKTGKFLTGLLPEIKLAIKKLGGDYELLDKRGLIEFKTSQVDENWLNEPIVLRDYQVDYINQAIRNRRGIIHAPTSAGKTHILLGILKALPDDIPTLVLTNSTTLLEQNYDAIKNICSKAGRFYGKVKDLQNITCATVQSCHLLEDWLKTVKAVLVDEIHDLMSPQAISTFNKLPDASVRIGMSATPFRYGEKDKVHKYKVKGFMGPAFLAQSTESGKITTKELQDRKILSSAECIFYYVREPKLPFAIYNDAVTYGIAENEIFHKMVCKLISGLDGRTLLLVERIAHGDRLKELIPDALWVRGQDNQETRKMVLDKLRESKEKVVAIATQKIFSTGINVYIKNLINCAGAQAEHQVIQRFGRGLRRADDKEHLYYYDFLFQTNDYLEKHSLKRIDILKKEGHKVTIKDF